MTQVPHTEEETEQEQQRIQKIGRKADTETDYKNLKNRTQHKYMYMHQVM